MLRVCLISFCNIYQLPYATDYVRQVVNSGSECSLLFWDRDAEGCEKDRCDEACVLYPFKKKLAADSSGSEKLFGYISAVRYFKKVLLEQCFDRLVFLQTHAAVACQGVLKKHYSGRYIVDIRDYTLENLSLYRRLEEKVIDSSFSTVVSSPAYRAFLPEHEYVTAHNYTPFTAESIDIVKNAHLHTQREAIGISFVGTVRFYDVNKQILQRFANDKRFNLNYYGRGSEVLKAYCNENGILNVDFYGSFSPGQTLDFYSKTDLINNVYGNNMYLDYALSNKLYHAAQLGLPILVSPNTYMEQTVNKYGLGFTVDIDDVNVADKLFDWYKSFDFDKMKDGATEFLKTVKSDNDKFHEMCSDFCKP